MAAGAPGICGNRRIHPSAAVRGFHPNPTRIAGFDAVVSEKPRANDRRAMRRHERYAALPAPAQRIVPADAGIPADREDVRMQRFRRTFVFGAIAAAAAGWGAAVALAGQSHTVIQKDRAFQVKQIDIAAGDSVQFSNEDQFLHQIYVASGGLDFDSREQPPGDVISINFPNPGTFEIRCHIHPKMSLFVNVK